MWQWQVAGGRRADGREYGVGHHMAQHTDREDHTDSGQRSGEAEGRGVTERVSGSRAQVCTASGAALAPRPSGTGAGENTRWSMGEGD